ncbi:MAG: alpha/beta fold hydrolase [Planctomycetota bacterium]|jgi:pimeloyl-ACP methyl ester carboxylesterase
MIARDASWRGLYPFQSRYWSMPYGLRLHYVDEGPGVTDTETPTEPTSGARRMEDACVLAVHGNPTWSFYYRALVQAIRPSHRVLAVDHLGCGWSSKPQSYSYALANHTERLVQFIESLDLRRIVMVVHDWGGAIGLGASLQCLDRMAGLVVLNTGAFVPPYIPLRIAACRLPWVGSWAIRYANAFALGATRMAIHRLARLDDGVASGLLAPYDTPGNRIGIDSFVRDIPLSPLHPTYRVLQNLEMHLPELQNLPIRLVWGMKDWCFRPECLRRFQSYWPDAQCLELDDVGHYVMEEAPEEVIDQVRALLAIA